MGKCLVSLYFQLSGGPDAHLVSLEKEYEKNVVAQGMLDANDGVYVRYWIGMKKEDASQYLFTEAFDKLLHFYGKENCIKVNLY